MFADAICIGNKLAMEPRLDGRTWPPRARRGLFRAVERFVLTFSGDNDPIKIVSP
jgi:hypothetical protein